MPEDLTKKQINLVGAAIAVGVQLDGVLDQMASLIAQYPFVGTIAPETLEGTAAQHLTPADVTNLVSGFEALTTYMAAGNRRDIYRKVRP